jgi:hypothetical protein
MSKVIATPQWLRRFLYDLRMDVECQQVTGAAVPEPVQPNLAAAFLHEVGDDVIVPSSATRYNLLGPC